jgi:hypothetical protein
VFLLNPEPAMTRWTLVFAAALTGLGLESTAASVSYRVAGTLGESAALSPFVLDLNFAADATPDPRLISSDRQGYTTTDWALALGGSASSRTFSDADTPGQLGFALFTGELVGFDASQTRVELGVGPEDTPGFGSLIRLEFVAPDLAPLFATNAVADAPVDPVFVAGQVRVDASGPVLPVTEASLVVTTATRDEVDRLGGGSADPAAVPTPTAAVAGLLLLLMLCINQTHRARRAAVID